MRKRGEVFGNRKSPFAGGRESLKLICRPHAGSEELSILTTRLRV